MKKRICICLITLMSCVSLLFGLGLTATAASGEAKEIAPLAHYEFSDAANPGKDSRGNFDLIAENTKGNTGGTVDVANGTAAFDGKNLLRAKVSGGKEFSDYLDSFSYSFYVSTPVTDRTVFAGGGGWRGGGLSIEMKKTDIWVRTGNNIQTFMEAHNLDFGEMRMVTLTADKPSGDIKLYIDGILTASKTVQSDDIFMSMMPDSYFCVGGEYHHTGETSQFVGALKDVRVYDFALSAESVKALADKKEVTTETETTVITAVEKIKYDGRIKKTTQADIDVVRAQLPATVSFTDSSSAQRSASVLWKTMTKGAENATVKGVLIGADCAGSQLFAPVVTLEYSADTADVAPLAHYEFSDAANPGKDSAGNFDLVQKDLAESGKITVEGGTAVFDGTAALYAPVSAGKDFSDYLGSYTVCYTVRHDVPGAVKIPVTAGWATGFQVEMNRFTDGGKIAYNNWITYGSDSNAKLNDVKMTPADTDGFVQVALTADLGAGRIAAYVDGELIAEKTGIASNDIFFGKGDTMFALGMRINTVLAAEMGFVGALKDVRVYDFALSACAVYDLHKGVEAELGEYTGDAVSSADPVEAKEFISENADAAAVIAALPKTALVRSASGAQKELSVLWLEKSVKKNAGGGAFEIEGLPLGSLSNPAGITVKATIRCERDVLALPVAWYLTNGDFDKDARGNFDLVEGDVRGQTGGEIAYEGDAATFDGKRVLYAPDFGSGRDFTDYVDGSYTVSFRIQPTAGTGVALSAGWYDGFLVESGLIGEEGNKKGQIWVRSGINDTLLEATFDADGMTAVALSANKAAGKVSLYINGALAMEKDIASEDIYMGLNDTLLALGARIQNSLYTDAPFVGKLSDVRVYDFALDAYSVKNVALDTGMTQQGTAALVPGAFETAEFDTDGLNLTVDAQNTEQAVLEALPKEATVGDGTAKILWYKAQNGTAFGQLYDKSGANLCGLTARVSLTYKITVSDGGATLAFEKDVVSYGDKVSFTVTPPAYSGVGAVKAGDEALEADMQSGKYSFEFAGQSVTVSVIYEPQSVTYNVSGGTLPSGAADSYTADKGLKLAVPTREGYRFDGWYEDELYGGTAVTEIAVGEGGAREYYAKWTKVSKITYRANGGSLPSDVKNEIAENESYTLPVPRRTGYRFDGWYKTESFDEAQIAELSEVTADTELFAKWTILRFTLSFDTQGGSETQSQELDYGGFATVPSDPTREGYVFAGWFSDSECTVEFSLYNPIESDVTVYAKWEKAADEKGCGGFAGEASLVASVALLSAALAFMLIRKRGKKHV